MAAEIFGPSRRRWNCWRILPRQRKAQSRQEIARGEGLSLDQVEQMMAERFWQRRA
jgi:hypothetical protein